jgi:hypothetical protein
MSAVWHDTPAYYSTSTIAAHWDVVSDLGVDSNDGYASGPALTGTSASGYGIQDVRGFAGGQVFAYGRRFKYTAAPSVEKPILGICGPDRALLVVATMLTDARVAVYRGNLEQLLGVTTAAPTASTQLRLGLAGILGAGTTGSIQLEIDGEVIAIASGVDTGSTPWRGVYVGATTAMFHSHLYAADDGLLRPGYLVEYETATNTDLDDTDHDGDTTVDTLAEGVPVSETLTSPTTKRTIYGVRTIAVVKHFLPTTGWIPQLTIEGTVYDADRQPVDTTYRAKSQFYALNPATGAPFSGAEWIDAGLEIGGESVA